MGRLKCFSDHQATMDGVREIKEFLGSSTIHGLSHIAANRGLARLFWLGVVIWGFTGAGLLIQQSFSSWAVSPISTTIETLPISELEFPNVTVCPPRKSFTNLNPDIVRSEKISLSEGQRQALSEQVPGVVLASNMERKWRDYTEYEETNRYRNQYHGISTIQLPIVLGSGSLTRLKYKGKKYIFNLYTDFSIELKKIIIFNS